jgi:hypothetical protein
MVRILCFILLLCAFSGSAFACIPAPRPDPERQRQAIENDEVFFVGLVKVLNAKIEKRNNYDDMLFNNIVELDYIQSYQNKSFSETKTFTFSAVDRGRCGGFKYLNRNDYLELIIFQDKSNGISYYEVFVGMNDFHDPWTKELSKNINLSENLKTEKNWCEKNNGIWSDWRNRKNKEIKVGCHFGYSEIENPCGYYNPMLSKNKNHECKQISP